MLLPLQNGVHGPLKRYLLTADERMRRTGGFFTTFSSEWVAVGTCWLRKRSTSGGGFFFRVCVCVCLCVCMKNLESVGNVIYFKSNQLMDKGRTSV